MPWSKTEVDKELKVFMDHAVGKQAAKPQRTGNIRQFNRNGRNHLKR
jgi:hypothetical protein